MRQEINITLDFINLYTRQHENSFFELEHKGRISNKEIYIKLHMGDIADFFLDKYAHFTRMAERIVARPSDVDYPIWCSVSKANCLKPIKKELVYALRVPRDQIVYFDGTKWDYVLNNLYLPADKEDEEKYRKKLNQHGIRSSFDLILDRNKQIYQLFEEEITSSWQRIFDIEDWSPFSIQANLWEIKKEWVIHILKPGDDIFALTDMEETFPPSIKYT